MTIAVLIFFLFASIWTRLFVKVFVFYVPRPRDWDIWALRIVCLGVATWLMVGIIRARLR